MGSFLAGILITVFILFLGVKLEKLKIEYGDFKKLKSEEKRPVNKPSDNLK